MKFVIAVWAFLKTGMIPVPVNVRASWEEIEKMIENIEPDAVLFSKEFSEDIIKSFGNSDVSLICMDKVIDAGNSVINWEDFVKKSKDSEPNIDVLETDDAVILFTGGITGIPKGAILTHRNLMHLIINIMVFNDSPRPEHLIVHPLPMSHISGFSRMLTYIWAGATYVSVKSFDPELCLELIQKWKVTAIMGGPLIFLPMLNVQKKLHYDTSSVLFCNNSFSFIHKGDIENMLKVLWPNAAVYESYGLTEGGGADTILRPDHIPEEFGSCGLPLLHTKVSIVDDIGKEMANGYIGEIILRSPRYLQVISETQRKLIRHLLKVGYILVT